LPVRYTHPARSAFAPESFDNPRGPAEPRWVASPAPSTLPRTGGPAAVPVGHGGAGPFVVVGEAGGHGWGRRGRARVAHAPPPSLRAWWRGFYLTVNFGFAGSTPQWIRQMQQTLANLYTRAFEHVPIQNLDTCSTQRGTTLLDEAIFDFWGCRQSLEKKICSHSAPLQRKRTN